MFPLPTCPFRSASSTILSYFDTLSINPYKFFQTSFFSFMLLPTCGAYVLTVFNIDPSTSNFMAISLSCTLFTSKTISTSSSLTAIPIPIHLSSAQLYNSLHPAPMFLTLLLFHIVSCRHSAPTFLPFIVSTSSLPLPVIVPKFKVPTLMTVGLPFLSSRCLFTRLPRFFLFMFSLKPAVS